MGMERSHPFSLLNRYHATCFSLRIHTTLPFSYGYLSLSSISFPSLSPALAPEYASSGKLTEKSDIFSFGVMLLELITGRRPMESNNDDDSLIDWARPILTQAADGGSYDELVDPRLKNNYNLEEMHRMVVCASACLRHSARRRPKMRQVVRALEGDASLDDLNDGGKSGGMSSAGSSDVDLHKKYTKQGTSSQESSSGDQGRTGDIFHSGGRSGEMRQTNQNTL